MYYYRSHSRKKLLEKEKGTIIKKGHFSLSTVLIYPNSYELGMCNLGFQTVYGLLNASPVSSCERAFFLPESEDPLFNSPMTIENGKNICQFDVLGFSVSFEMDYEHVVYTLMKNNLDPFALDRNATDPLVILGGPVAFMNPEPLAPFIDIFFVGEGELLIPAFIDSWVRKIDRGENKEQFLERIHREEGFYVPKFYQIDYDEVGTVRKLTVQDNAVGRSAIGRVKRIWLENLDDVPSSTKVYTPEVYSGLAGFTETPKSNTPSTKVHNPDTHFGELKLVEVGRGCCYRCRFCTVTQIYYPYRYRSYDALAEEISNLQNGSNDIGLVSSALSDYPELDMLCDDVAGRGGRIGLSSFRVDKLSYELAKNVAESGSRTITVAPEAGTERLRKIINKRIPTEKILEGVKQAGSGGIERIKLYFIIGLPMETHEDIQGIVDLTLQIRDTFFEFPDARQVVLTLSDFVPKPWTPFQWEPMSTKRSLEEKVKFIRSKFWREKGIAVRPQSPREAVEQTVLACGDRRVGNAIHYSIENKVTLKIAMKRLGLNADFYVRRRKNFNEIFPWDMIDQGTPKSRLWKDYQLSQRY